MGNGLVELLQRLRERFVMIPGVAWYLQPDCARISSVYAIFLIFSRLSLVFHAILTYYDGYFFLKYMNCQTSFWLLAVSE